ncbi:MAG: glycosyltransferase family 4 protein, partial [Lachnospiraceae bacterium]|nr:glycosyltransferase family 4 protein [Lachnospiraceae bacterium]
EGTWDLTECDRHVICMSQGDYPLKGLHKILAILPDIVADYPDASLVIAGMDITRRTTFKDRLKISNYGKYLTELIASGKLQGKVRFTGPLNAAGMKEMYLKSHTYLCASSIENSPNSMGEAMMLGVPVIAARVGGIPSMIEDGTEGLLYDSTDEIKDLIHKIWDDDAYATEIGAAAMNRAYKTHDADTNMRRLLEIYNEIR